MRLSETKIRALRLRDADYKITDEKGLYAMREKQSGVLTRNAGAP